MIRKDTQILEFDNINKILNETFFPNPFSFKKEVINPSKRILYIEYDESTPSNLIEQMEQIIYDEENKTILDIKQKILPKLNSLINKYKVKNTLPFTTEQYELIKNWIDNQSLSCPSIIIYNAFIENKTPISYATQIIEDLNVYNADLQNIQNIIDSYLINVIHNNDVWNIIETLRDTIDTIKSI
jgi:hypothetical protein